MIDTAGTLIAETWAWVAANADGLAASAALATAAVAMVALAATASDSRARSRPLVIAEFRQAEHSDSSIELIVHNYGQSAARDLRVVFDPPLELPEGKERMTKWLVKRYAEPIQLLSPGGEFQNLWFAGTATGATDNELVNAEATPDAITVKVSYRGNRVTRYRDRFALDVTTVKYTTTSVSSASPRGKINSISDSLKHLDDSLKGIKGSLAAMASNE